MTNKKTTEKNKQSSILLSIKLFFKRIDNELETNFRKWIRSPTTIFFTLLYPIIFILILGSIFSGIEEPFSFELYVQNKDQGVDLGYTTYNFWNDTIEPIITGINNSDNESLINVLDVPLIDGEGANISAGIYLEQQEGYICVVIPETFTAKVLSKTPVNLTIISVETVQSAGIVSEILLNILYDFNIGFNNETYKVQLETVDFLVGEEITYVEYLLPGMIAITFMNNALMSTITRFNYNRTTGFFKKLSSSPMRRVDFVTSEMIWQFLLSILSMLVSVFTGWIAFGVPLSIMHWMMIPAMLAGIMTFSGIGMIGARIVKSPNAAGAIGNVLTYPMMFLSGAFFDVSHIPALYYISKALPLTYIVDTMRAAMVTNNMPIAWMNLGISFGLAVIFMGIGILLTKWTED